MHDVVIRDALIHDGTGAAGLRHFLADCALVIFHIAFIGGEVGVRCSLKNCEDAFGHFTGFRVANYVG